MAKGDYSKALLRKIVIANIIFTTVVLLIFYKTGLEPTAVCAGWYGFWGIEVWKMAHIKTEKIKGERYGDESDSEYSDSAGSDI